MIGISIKDENELQQIETTFNVQLRNGKFEFFNVFGIFQYPEEEIYNLSKKINTYKNKINLINRKVISAPLKNSRKTVEFLSRGIQEQFSPSSERITLPDANNCNFVDPKVIGTIFFIIGCCQIEFRNRNCTIDFTNKEIKSLRDFSKPSRFYIDRNSVLDFQGNPIEKTDFEAEKKSFNCHILSDSGNYDPPSKSQKENSSNPQKENHYNPQNERTNNHSDNDSGDAEKSFHPNKFTPKSYSFNFKKADPNQLIDNQNVSPEQETFINEYKFRISENDVKNNYIFHQYELQFPNENNEYNENNKNIDDDSSDKEETYIDIEHMDEDIRMLNSRIIHFFEFFSSQNYDISDLNYYYLDDAVLSFHIDENIPEELQYLNEYHSNHLIPGHDDSCILSGKQQRRFNQIFRQWGWQFFFDTDRIISLKIEEKLFTATINGFINDGNNNQFNFVRTFTFVLQIDEVNTAFMIASDILYISTF